MELTAPPSFLVFFHTTILSIFFIVDNLEGYKYTCDQLGLYYYCWLPFTKQKRVKMETSGKQKCAVYQAFLLENLLVRVCVLHFVVHFLFAW